MKANEQITVGLIYRGQIRGNLDALKMYGNIDGYTEVKGLLKSVFYIKGVDATAASIFLGWHRLMNE